MKGYEEKIKRRNELIQEQRNERRRKELDEEEKELNKNIHRGKHISYKRAYEISSKLN